MKFWPLVALLGTARAQLLNMSMVSYDLPMSTVSLAPEIATCCRLKPTNSLNKFKRLIRQEQLTGPCRFSMKRIYIGNATDYLEKTEQYTFDEALDFMSFLVDIQAPKEFQSYIDTIHLEQQKPSGGCRYFRMSRQPTAAQEEAPRYFRDLTRHDFPTWHVGGRKQIEGGRYLLQVPRACIINPTQLIIETMHFFENATSQIKSVKGQGKIFGHSDDCSLPEEGMPVDSYGQYREAVMRLSRRCGHSYEREYKMAVPATHISVMAGKTTVLAQIAMNEPMLGDHKRDITRLALSRLRGVGCSKTALYARKKERGEELAVRVPDVKFHQHSAYVEAPWDFADPIYDFRFVLPPDCQISNPSLRFIVDDHNDDVGIQSVQQPSTPISTLKKVVWGTDGFFLESDEPYLSYWWNGTHNIQVEDP